MCSCRLRQIRAGWGGSPSREGHVGRTTLQLVACAPAPPRQALGAWGQVGVLASSVLSSLALLEEYSIKDTAAGWNAEGQAWPPPVSEPLCPGVLDLGAEQALDICHEAVGNFATVSRRAGQEQWASLAIHCAFATG